MSASERKIRRLGEADLPAALGLSQLAGWNQALTDWRRILEYEPTGCFAAVDQDRVIGTVTTTSYGTDLAWIGMMLVHPDYRRQGIATELMQRSLCYLKDQEIGCIKLDATPAGQPVYERLGFQAEWEFSRWERPGIEEPDGLSTAEAGEIDISLDARIFGSDRSDWLKRISQSAQVMAEENGYGMIRSGRIADYFGPAVFSEQAVAEATVRSLLESTQRRVFWDIPEPNLAAVSLATELGFTRVRPLIRMWTGSQLVAGNPARQWGLADPATG